jgi:hypothetical protein
MHVFEDNYSRTHTAVRKQRVAKPTYRTRLTQQILELAAEF